MHLAATTACYKSKQQRGQCLLHLLAHDATSIRQHPLSVHLAAEPDVHLAAKPDVHLAAEPHVSSH